jgi:hypothetical protein
MPRKGGGPSPTSFKKGESGNPNGRPKSDPELVALARENSVPALRKIIAIMNNPAEDERDPTKADRTVLHAAQLVIERGYGRAPQTIAHDHVHNLTDHELHRQLREAAAELRAIGYGHLLDEPAGDDEKKPH